MTASPAPTPMNVSSTAKIRMEMRAHPRRRKIAMAVQIPQPLKRANIEAIAIPIAAMENGGAAGPLGGGASVMPNSIKPPNTRVARLPAMARPPLARIPIHFLAMIADQCTGLSARGPGGARRQVVCLHWWGMLQVANARLRAHSFANGRGSHWSASYARG